MQQSDDHEHRNALWAETYEVCSFFHMRRVYRILSSFYDEAICPTGLKATQYGTLLFIRMLPEAPVSLIADRVGVARSTMIRDLRPLARDGWIQFGRKPDNRKARTVSLTPKGIAEVDLALERWREGRTRFEKRIGKKNCEVLVEGLRHVSIVVDLGSAIEMAWYGRRRPQILYGNCTGAGA